MRLLRWHLPPGVVLELLYRLLSFLSPPSPLPLSFLLNFACIVYCLSFSRFSLFLSFPSKHLSTTISRGEDDDQFYRGLSNLYIVNGAGNPGATGMHWAQSQAAHIHNVTIDMSAGGKAGFFGENGSGGFIDGLTIIGGVIPFQFGNQQFAVNNLVIVGDASTTACANLFWSWTLTFTRMSLSNCPTGITFLGGAAGALLLIDSTMTNVPLGVQTDYKPGQPWANASTLYFERLTATGVAQITEGLAGGGAGVVTIESWVQGPTYRKGLLVGEGQSTLPLMQPNPVYLPLAPPSPI